jgi:hypothetical protein
MPAPDPQTLAARSGVVPRCAKRSRLLALALCLFSACLNPRPEEFPPEGEAVMVGPGLGGSHDDSVDQPTLPGESSGPDVTVGGAGGSGTGSGIPPATQPPANIEGDGEAAAPDAGVDAGAAPEAATGADVEAAP